MNVLTYPTSQELMAQISNKFDTVTVETLRNAITYLEELSIAYFWQAEETKNEEFEKYREGIYNTINDIREYVLTDADIENLPYKTITNLIKYLKEYSEYKANNPNESDKEKTYRVKIDGRVIRTVEVHACNSLEAECRAYAEFERKYLTTGFLDGDTDIGQPEEI